MPRYVSVGRLSDFAPGSILGFKVEGDEVAVVLAEGDFYAFSNSCTPMAAPLTTGYIAGREIACLRHDSVFSMESGVAIAGPANESLDIYDVKVEGDEVLIARR